MSEMRGHKDPAETPAERGERLARQARIASVPCPACNAPAGENCRTPRGTVTLLHQARRSAAADAKRYVPWSITTRCGNWTDSCCSRSKGHERGFCWSEDDGMVWRDATDEEEDEFRAELIERREPDQ